MLAPSRQRDKRQINTSQQRPRNPRPAAPGTPIPVRGRIGKRGFPVSRPVPDSGDYFGIGKRGLPVSWREGASQRPIRERRREGVTLRLRPAPPQEWPKNEILTIFSLNLLNLKCFGGRPRAHTLKKRVAEATAVALVLRSTVTLSVLKVPAVPGALRFRCSVGMSGRPEKMESAGAASPYCSTAWRSGECVSRSIDSRENSKGDCVPIWLPQSKISSRYSLWIGYDGNGLNTFVRTFISSS